MYEEALGYLLVLQAPRNPRAPLSEECEGQRYINVSDESLSLIVFNFCSQSTTGYLYLIFLDSLLYTTLSSIPFHPFPSLTPREPTVEPKHTILVSHLGVSHLDIVVNYCNKFDVELTAPAQNDKEIIAFLPVCFSLTQMNL
jgi:hypothetical protein